MLDLRELREELNNVGIDLDKDWPTIEEMMFKEEDGNYDLELFGKVPGMLYYDKNGTDRNVWFLLAPQLVAFSISVEEFAK